MMFSTLLFVIPFLSGTSISNAFVLPQQQHHHATTTGHQIRWKETTTAQNKRRCPTELPFVTTTTNQQCCETTKKRNVSLNTMSFGMSEAMTLAIFGSALVYYRLAGQVNFSSLVKDFVDDKTTTTIKKEDSFDLSAVVKDLINQDNTTSSSSSSTEMTKKETTKTDVDVPQTKAIDDAVDEYIMGIMKEIPSVDSSQPKEDNDKVEPVVVAAATSSPIAIVDIPEESTPVVTIESNTLETATMDILETIDESPAAAEILEAITESPPVDITKNQESSPVEATIQQITPPFESVTTVTETFEPPPPLSSSSSFTMTQSTILNDDHERTDIMNKVAYTVQGLRETQRVMAENEAKRLATKIAASVPPSPAESEMTDLSFVAATGLEEKRWSWRRIWRLSKRIVKKVVMPWRKFADIK